MNALEKLVKNKRVAIIGPSPHLEEKNLGQKIDSYDVVCRINAVSYGDTEDYGLKTDISFLNLSDSSLNCFRSIIEYSKDEFHKIKLIVCPRHSLHVSPFHLKNFSPDKNIFNNYKTLNLDKELFHIGNETNERFEKTIGCHPTLGSLAIMTLLEYDLKELFIGGISFYQTKARYNQGFINTMTQMKLKEAELQYRPPGHNIQQEIYYFKQNISKYPFVTGDFYFTKLFLE